MTGTFRLAADAIVTIHVAYVAFVVLGLARDLVGDRPTTPLGPQPLLRYLHPTMILIVVAEAWAGITCSSPPGNNGSGDHSGGSSYRGDFIATCLRPPLHRRSAVGTFTVAYSLFGLARPGNVRRPPPRRWGAAVSRPDAPRCSRRNRRTGLVLTTVQRRRVCLRIAIGHQRRSHLRETGLASRRLRLVSRDAGLGPCLFGHGDRILRRNNAAPVVVGATCVSSAPEEQDLGGVIDLDQQNDEGARDPV